MDESKSAARPICQTLLERSSAALMSDDFEAFADCFILPQEMETFEGRRVVETLEQGRVVFDALRKFQLRAGVTEVVRHCVEAEFRSEDVVEMTYETRIVAGDRLLQRPYPVFSVLRRDEGVWKFASSQYAIVDAPELTSALHAKAEAD